MRHIFNAITLLATMLLAWACTGEEPAALPDGTVRFAITSATECGVTTGTRATPSELGKPLAEKFALTIQRTGNSQPTYDGKFVESMDLPIGTYDITARYGEDVPIGRDAPYYVGTAQAVIENGKTSSAMIPCRVGNALVSVRFGRDADEKARFEKFYSDYGVKVKLGAYSMDITPRQEASSIYFPAGSSPKISFFGCVRNDNGRPVSIELTSESLPTTFERADHAIITLYLPDPETSSVIDISAVEVETVTMEQTIPLSWLPLPTVSPAHNYDANGCLQGTDITFGNGYPGMRWRAEVTDAANNVCRTVEGTGELRSNFGTNASGWPYLPAGEYTATYYLIQDGKAARTGARTFTVGNPDIRVTTSCHTSYSLYLDGNVTGANACDPYTVYSPRVSVNIVPSLWQNPLYAATLTTTLAGTTINASSTDSGAEGTVFSFADQQDLTPSLDGHTLAASVNFGMAEATASNTVYVTGLPCEFDPQNKDNWTNSGKITWYDDRVMLGYMSTGSQSISCSRFAVPAGVKIRAPYKALANSGIATTTLSMSFGSYQYFRETCGRYKQITYEDVASFTTTSPVTQASANNSYGAGNTYSYIYYLRYYYAE